MTDLAPSPAAVAQARGGVVRPLIALAAFAILCFASVYNYGYEWGDMGTYAQICFELTLGSRPGDFVGYGPLWYFLGEGVFLRFGVDYTALLVMVYGLLVLVAGLLFLGVRAACGRVWPALLAALVFILVPPFTASTVRALCLAINLLPLVWLARARPGHDLGQTLLAGAAVGLTFLLRPDFGYLFLSALLVVLSARAWFAAHTPGGRLRRFGGSVLAAAAAMAAVLAPVVYDAVVRGYLTPVLADYLELPRRFLHFYAASTSFSDMGGGGGHDGGFLRILPVSALFGADLGERSFAFLIYSTMLGMAAFAAWLLVRWRLRPADSEANLVALTVLLVTASQWPIFVLFRPSWAHFTSFMHAYLVLAAFAAAKLAATLSAGWPRQPVRAAAAAVPLALLAVQTVLFIGHGVQAPGVGILAQRADRDTVFEAPPGLRVIVSKTEEQQLETIDHLIRSHSEPGDRIVCVPYCPGYAFMAGRRLLFREHYVDDAIPLLYPGWIDRAIARTAEVRPPVIIVQDWAPNGTESSRFSNWARRYLDAVRASYPVSVPIQGVGTAWLLHPADPARAEMLTVTAYGPVATPAGQPFNRQPDGSSALWLQVSGLHPTATIRFDDRPLESAVAGDGISAVVPPALFATPGRHWLQVVDEAFNQHTSPVPFDVTPP